MNLNKITLALASSAAAFALTMGTPAWALGTPAASARATAASAPMSSGSPMSAAASQHSPASAVSGDKALLAAAESFENLTEMAFSSNWLKIDGTISEAEHAASAARGSLPQEAVGTMDAHLAAMTAARQKHDRADLALSSIEVYRVLVSSVSAGTRIPAQVSLLDYAGFRYDADLKSSPIRWGDMNQAVAFAHQQWAVIAPRLKNTPLATQFEKAVDGMDRAARQKNASLAAASVKSESDLVDELEAYFRKH
jgi:hypothetical protein